MLDGRKLPVQPARCCTGCSVARIATQIDDWSAGRDDRGVVAVRVRYYFERHDGTWTRSCRTSAIFRGRAFQTLSERRVAAAAHRAGHRGRGAFAQGPPSIVRRKVDDLPRVRRERGARAARRNSSRDDLPRAARVEERDARGTMPLEPYDGLSIDWEDAYQGESLVASPPRSRALARQRRPVRRFRLRAEAAEDHPLRGCVLGEERAYRVDRDARRGFERVAVDAGRDRREGDAARADALRRQQRRRGTRSRAARARRRVRRARPGRRCGSRAWRRAESPA